MSRTYKDKPSKITHPNLWFYNSLTGFWDEPPQPKKKKRKDTEWHWMTTPSWWTRLTMNRPKRKKQNRQLRVIPDDLEQLDLVDVADTGNKPHEYYW